MTSCLLAIASFRGFASFYASPITFLACIIGIPAIVALAVLSYVLKRAEEEEEEVNDDENTHYAMMSTREWLAQRYVPCALEAAIVESIPLVKFASAAVYEPFATSSSCVVCLAPFQEDEELKVLPPCQHAFHPLCIDPWFETNSTCPICRSEVTPSTAKARGIGEALASCQELTHVPLIDIVVD